jgi:hypothetical protein
MEVCHQEPLLQSPALQRLGQFVETHRQQWAERVPELEQFEHELHQHVRELEREMLAAELARYDLDVAQIEVEGVSYQPTLTATETYLSAAGPLCVSRHLYRPTGRGSKSICPLELRAGIIAGHFTPRAARQAAFVTAQLTPGESAALFAELENMCPSRASLDRLPKELSPQWESQRTDWEAALRTQETVPAEARVMAISVDGVMVAMKAGAAQRRAKQAEAGKHASGPSGHQEVGCGTVVLYDADGERLQTVRYGRMPESKKVTLQAQVSAETASILVMRPDLRRVYLADGAKDNWRLLAEVEAQLAPASEPSVQIADFYHACDHLKKACDAAWGESSIRSQAEFERLKTLLKADEQGTERVLRVLSYRRGLARGSQRTRLQAELTYFRNQRPHMHYAAYVRQGLPIASGVIEAACKTLVTQRLKRSGMAWAPAGGQAILTLRSVIQSGRWPAAWQLFSAAYRKPVVVRDAGERPLAAASWAPSAAHPTPTIHRHPALSSLPLAA